MSVINYLSVTMFGMVLVIWFGNIKLRFLTVVEFIGMIILGGLINSLLSAQLGVDAPHKFYPLVIHLPLLAYCVVRLKQPVWHSVFAITMAYMLTTPRKWLFETLSYFSTDSAVTTAIFDFSVSILLLALAYRFLVPKINTIFHGKKHETNLLCIPPVAFYLCSYLMTIYTDLLYYNERLTIAILITGFSLFFTFFELYYYSYLKKKYQTEHTEKLLYLQLKSIQRISKRIMGENNNYCKNQLLNTVLTLYQTEGRTKGLNMIFSLNLTEFPKECNNRAILLITDLLEDSLEEAKEYISLTAIMKNKQLCIMLENDRYKEHKESVQEILKRYREISAVNEKEKGIQLLLNI